MRVAKAFHRRDQHENRHAGEERSEFSKKRGRVSAAAARNSAGLSGPPDRTASVEADAILTNSRNGVCGDTAWRLLVVQGR